MQTIRSLRRSSPFLRRTLAKTGLGFGKIRSLREIQGVQADQVFVPASRITLDQPEACDFLPLQSYVPLVDGCTIERHAVFACRLPHAKLHMRTGIVCTADNTILLESGVDQRRIESSSFYGMPRWRKTLRLEGTYTSIWGQFTHNHGHWLVECLPRLYSLKQAAVAAAIAKNGEPITVLMPETMTPLQRESFLACLPDGVSVRYLPLDTVVEAENYLYLSHATGGTAFFLLPRDYLDYVRGCLFRHYNVPSIATPNKRVFIRRQKAKYRRCLNEPEVEQLVKRYGFDGYDLEDLSFAEQVRLFSDTAAVISPHSSGLINMMFAPPSAQVLEIFSGAPEPAFFFLIKAGGQQYHFTFSEEAPRDRVFPTFAAQPSALRAAINSDFTVDLAELQRWLDQHFGDQPSG